MTDQPKTPAGQGDPPPSPLRDSVASATQRIQMIIEAAEKAAAGIIEDAEAQARRYLEESRRRADRIADERARVMSELTDSLIDRAETVKRQSDDLIAALDQAKLQIDGRAGEETAAVPAPAPEVAAPATPQPVPEPRPVPHLKPVAPPRALEEVPPPAEAVPDAHPHEGSGAGDAESAPRANSEGPSAGARLLATQMAVAGSSRAEIESRLRNEFGIVDAAAMLDAILGPEG